MELEIRNLSFSFKDHKVLKDVSFSVQKGDFLSVLGPNGVGKSTLFRCILGSYRNYTGSVLIDGRDSKEMHPRELASHIAYIPQAHKPTFGYSVLDVVLMSAARHLSPFSTPSSKDTERSMDSLDKLGISHLAQRDFMKLSGGEQQLVLVARAISQNADILIMDEPTSSLDFGNQLKVLERVCRLSEEGYTVLLSTHNPQHAMTYSAKVLALYEGSVAAFGPSKDIMTEELMKTLYGVPISILNTDRGGIIVPERNREERS